MYPKYEDDFYGWTLANAQLMREGKMNEVDFENIIEEIESMGRSTFDQLVNRLCVLMAHLLKWQYQAEKRKNGWRATINEQRRQIKRLMRHHPSLKSRMEEAFSESYEDAAGQASDETEKPKSTFPERCPYTLEQCLDEDFYPE